LSDIAIDAARLAAYRVLQDAVGPAASPNALGTELAIAYSPTCSRPGAAGSEDLLARLNAHEM
jgi:hypothetical protein